MKKLQRKILYPSAELSISPLRLRVKNSPRFDNRSYHRCRYFSFAKSARTAFTFFSSSLQSTTPVSLLSW